MSLFKQLLIAIFVFMLIIFSGSFVVNLESSRDQYTNQLLSHAQDAATALGLSLTPHVDDPAMIELMVSSIFDSGYYNTIRIVDQSNGKTILERSTSTSIPDVPHWFVGLVDVKPQAGEATIMRGWQQAARVEVVSNPVFAIKRLWDSTLANLLWMLACCAVCILAGAMLLRRQLRPLNYMVEQSQAITRREYLTQLDLPKTPELRRVVEAMNLMVTKLKSLFEDQAEHSERLHNEAYLDSQTGVANRRAFDLQMQSRLSDEETAPGYLLLLRIQDLSGLNQRFGGPHTDNLLKHVADMMSVVKSQHAKADSILARIRGGEFALLCPGVTHTEMLNLQHALTQQLSAFYATGMSDINPVAHTGMVPFNSGDTPQSLFVQADRVLIEAETRTTHQTNDVPAIDNAATEDQHLWFTRLDNALSQRQFQLFFQPVVDCKNPKKVIHYKVLSRMVDEDGNSITAGRFLPWVHRFGWSHRLDQVMLALTLKQLKSYPGSLALSLSGHSLANEATIKQLLNPLKVNSALANRLILELDENQLPEPAQMELFVKSLNQFGCGLGLQHFGSRFDMIGHFSQWGLAYLKIDSSYIRHIDIESDKRLFIDVLHSATNNIDLPLIAERVETAGELRVLQEVGIYGAMGQLLGEPAPF
ncbi:GGDEF/EAL domain protein [Buttiauxella ferragutiae ATCC 51602]|uniref:GGDEF/EAL domain protein n=1 Tax=Buttiauxella ferragutiae ATCC 51602 TaxID=1354252 RepID=A0ABX2W9R9_9ENTR|nr:EAL domain-containing protein [Buttiauxella ferragutiae]OAT28754.1 GGDEF/EAL domain protein [Buttiauxella ferragutiae ATCC 51602]